MIAFWFEFASTYSYPAAMRIERLAAEAGIGVAWHPFLLGPLLHQQQGMADSPFNVVPVKGQYMWRDFARVCAAEKLPLKKPAAFPQNGLKAARLTAVLPQDARGAFVKSVYSANFAEDLAISDDSTLTAILTRLGHHAPDLLAASQSDAVKAAVKANTEEAARRGVFGSPTVFAPDGEMFWGNDRLEEAIAWAKQPELISAL